MKLTEQDKIDFKKWFKEILLERKATVIFTKSNGEVRTMVCTTNIALLPNFEIKENSAPKKARKVNDDVMCVFDLEANAWKSFRWDSVEKVSFDIL